MHLAHKHVQRKSLARDALHKAVDLGSEQVERVQFHVLQLVVATCQLQLRLAHSCSLHLLAHCCSVLQ
jgi:hypothetical protein